MIGLAFAVVILIIAFGSVHGHGPARRPWRSPGSASAPTLLLLSTNFFAVPDFAQFLGLMIGLGVGIDYALFIVTRYRENLHHGHTVAGGDLHRHRHGRPGRHLRRRHGGHLLPRDARHGRLVRLGPRHLRCPGGRHHRRRVAHPAARPSSASPVSGSRSRAGAGSSPPGSSPSRCSAVGLGVPAIALPALVLAAVVIALGFALAPLKRQVPTRAAKPIAQDDRLPLEPAHPAQAVAVVHRRHRHPGGPRAARCSGCASASPTRATTRRTPPPARPTTSWPTASGPGFNGPLLLVAEVPEGADPAELERSARPSPPIPNVAFVTPPIPNDPDRPHRGASGGSIPKTAPQDAETTSLVNRLRDDVLPSVRGRRRRRRRPSPGSPRSASTSATTSARASSYFFAAVLVLSFLLLMTVFRSVLVPAQGGDHEPAVDRRRLRRRGRPVPVGLARRHHRASSRRPSSRSSR